MHDVKKKHPCHAVLVQYGHDLTSGERLNLGVILVCEGHGYVGARFVKKLRRITAAFPKADVSSLRRIGKHIAAAAKDWREQPQLAYSEAGTDARAFYHFVMPKMDSSVMLSHPISGITGDPDKTLAALYESYVAKFTETEERQMREDVDVWRTVVAKLESRKVNANRLIPKRVEGPHYEHTFNYAWQNGRWNVVQPISFDVADPAYIGDKAAKWSGKLGALHLGDHDLGVTILIGPPSGTEKEFRRAAKKGFELLSDELKGARVVLEDNADSVAEQIARDIGSDQSPLH